MLVFFFFFFQERKRYPTPFEHSNYMQKMFQQKGPEQVFALVDLTGKSGDWRNKYSNNIPKSKEMVEFVYFLSLVQTIHLLFMGGQEVYTGKIIL